MSEPVAVRDAPRTQLTVYHDCTADGRPACRQGVNPECTYRVIDRDSLPSDITKCDYCAGEHSPQTASRPGTLAHTLEHTDPEEVFGQ